MARGTLLNGVPQPMPAADDVQVMITELEGACLVPDANAVDNFARSINLVRKHSSLSHHFNSSHADILLETKSSYSEVES